MATFLISALLAAPGNERAAGLHHPHDAGLLFV
jgi:hypothetical protein